MSATFRSLSSPTFRVWFIGASVSNVGTWMQATAMNWVVLTELTEQSATALGIVLALQFSPPLLLVSVTGWMADRYDRVRIVLATQASSMALALAMGGLLLFDLMTLPLMYSFAVALGVVVAFDGPARQALVSDMVGTEHTSNAVALNSASFSGARMVGPATAGVVIAAVGSGWVFLVNGVTFVVMIVALRILRRSGIGAGSGTERTRGLAEGMRYTIRRRDLGVVVVMMAIIGAFGMNFAIVASTMAVSYGRGADGLGVLTSSVAVGALVGALVVARREKARFAAIVLGAGALVLAGVASLLASGFWAYAITLAATGLALELTVTSAHGYVQATAPAPIRGRVLALYMAIMIGATPVGAPIVGHVADAYGPRGAVLLSATSALAAMATGTAWLLAARRVRRHPTLRHRLVVLDAPPEAREFDAPAPAATIVTDHGTAHGGRPAKEHR